MSSFLYKLLNRRGIFFYLIFIIYLIYFHPILINRLAETNKNNPDPILGWVILLIPILELLGFSLKYPILAYYKRKYPIKQSNWTILVMVFLPILHLVMSALLFVVGVQIAGLQPEGNTAWYWQLLYATGFFIVLIKEAGFLALFFSFSGVKWTADQQYPPEIPLLKIFNDLIEEIHLRHIIRDTIGDICLLIFSTFGYTALWEYIGPKSPIYTRVGFWGYLTQLFGIFLYFMMVIPPLQAAYILRDSIVQLSKTQKFWSAVQFVILMMAAFLSVSKI